MNRTNSLSSGGSPAQGSDGVKLGPSDCVRPLKAAVGRVMLSLGIPWAGASPLEVLSFSPDCSPDEQRKNPKRSAESSET